ncbi:hypothetical protein Ddye_009348 [Dipteronia dyeriana]|uniref:MULE transposase domain-containing protein n=1 Tax=Dipteronia dyeriana TaxID=168575 RepID=A0AAD9XB66_9ROSI|nr:hypothetical protein Ddye_009348 [Dipteronia dyeriana]
MEGITTNGPKTITDDTLAQVVGKEHRGRIQGLGFGITPTKVQAVVVGKITMMQLQEKLNNLKQQFIELQTAFVNIQIGASLRGFRTCMCPVIAVDGTHLKERFWGTIFVATAQDGNEQGSLGHTDELVFISDRHPSIEAGICKVFPYATHTICCWHFTENIKKRFHRKDVAAIMDKAARAYTEFEYNRERNLDLTTLCSNYYKRQTLIDEYSVPIMPVGDPSTWVVPSDIAQRVVLNPNSRR